MKTKCLSHSDRIDRGIQNGVVCGMKYAIADAGNNSEKKD